MSSRPARRALGAWTLALTLGCGGSHRWAHWTDLPGARSLETAHDAPATVRRQAAADFGCEVESTHAEASPLDSNKQVYVAEGCGKRDVYVQVQWSERWADDYDVYLVRFVALGGDWKGALRRLEEDRARRLAAHGTGPGFAWELARDGAELVTALAGVRAQAARDLHCPVDQIVPGMDEDAHHLWPVAAGCERRAVYLPGFLVPPFRVRRLHGVPGVADSPSDEPGTDRGCSEPSR
jgi:hypothetical protein